MMEQSTVAATSGGVVGYLVGRGRGAPPQGAAQPSPSNGVASSAPSKAPSSAPLPSLAGPRVRFDAPGPSAPPIVGQSPVELAGTVDGPPPGDKLFIVSRTGDGDYFVVKGNASIDRTSYAAADRDGSRTARDGGVGSSADPSGRTTTFTPVGANADCAKALDDAGANDSHRLKKGAWPWARSFWSEVRIGDHGVRTHQCKTVARQGAFARCCGAVARRPA